MGLSYGDSTLRALYFRTPAFVKSWMAAAYSLRQRRNRFGGVFAQQLAELERSRGASAETLRAIQVKLLRGLLAHAGSHVVYYRKLFREAGFDPAALKDLADLRVVPLLEKETVRLRPYDLMTEGAGEPRMETHTSGTTGTALRLALSRDAYQRSYALMWFHYAWVGVHRGARVATAAGHPVTAPERMRPPFWVHDAAEHELLLSSQHLTPRTLSHYAEALSRFRPALVRGYPSSVYLIALHLLGRKRRDIRPIAVFTSSETLFDFQRAVIEEAFGCKAYSYYSNTERAAHILQCGEGRFHVVPESGVVEVLRPDGTPTAPGETGELVATSVLDRSMPLIRYRVGDTGAVAEGPCACGYASPTLATITGRAEDVIVTPDGRRVGRLDHAFKDMLNVREAQIVQEEVERLTVSIVPRQAFTDSDERLLREELRLRLGDEIRVEIRLVERIPRTANGKFRFVVSKVPMQMGGDRGRA